MMTLITFFPRHNDHVENEGRPPLASERAFSLIGADSAFVVVLVREQ
jgi:hypothetical protein